MKNYVKIGLIALGVLAVIIVGKVIYAQFDSTGLDAETVADYQKMAELDVLVEKSKKTAEKSFDTFSGDVAQWREYAKEYNALAVKHELGKEYVVPTVNSPF